MREATESRVASGPNGSAWDVLISAHEMRGQMIAELCAKNVKLARALDDAHRQIAALDALLTDSQQQLRQEAA